MPFSERFYVDSITRNNSSNFGENLRSLEKIDNPHFTATIATSGGLRFEYILRAVSLFLNLFCSLYLVACRFMHWEGAAVL